MLFHDIGDQALPCVLAGDVETGVACTLAEAGGGLLALGVQHVGEYDGGALADEDLGRRRAKTAGGPGHDGLCVPKTTSKQVRRHAGIREWFR